MNKKSMYIGRFAPSPTGPLHLGSLVAALASYLEARSHDGQWLLRMEDLDTPRCSQAAADSILRTLEQLGFTWDGEVMLQSLRQERYRELLNKLIAVDYVYPCACSRRELADAALAIDGAQLYPGTCRHGLPPGKQARSWRLNVGSAADITFNDSIQGCVTQNLATQAGDFVLLRADGYFAYQLAVVVDDADQGVTHIVRGADLLDSTSRQIFLQQCLHIASPRYAHVPMAMVAEGVKLSKQTHARAIDNFSAEYSLEMALHILGHSPPVGMTLNELWSWAIECWDMAQVPRQHTLVSSKWALEQP